MAWKFRLDDDYSYPCNLSVDKTVKFYDEQKRCWLEIHRGINNKSIIKINQGYQWDGCSPKFRIGDLMIIGVPDGIPEQSTGLPKTYYASLVHDALYQFINDPKMPYTRAEIDKIFHQMLLATSFYFADLYYYSVRCFGGVFHYLNNR